MKNNKTVNSDDKSIDLQNKLQTFDVNKNIKVLEMAYNSVVEGNILAESEFKKNPLRFRKLISQSQTKNDVIIEKFIQKFQSTFGSSNIKILDCYSMTYFLIDNKLFCFKSFDENKIIKNVKTKRVEEVLKGSVRLSKKVIEKLDKWGVVNPPVIFVGWLPNENNSFNDVRIINYFNNQIQLDVSLTELFLVTENEDVKVNRKQKENNIVKLKRKENL